MRFHFLFVFMLLATACSIGSGGGNSSPSGPAQKPVAAYCPYLPSRTFSTPITVTGNAYYEFRSNGNGPVSDSVHTITPSASTSYSLTINGKVASYTCSVACTAAQAVSGLKAVIDGDSSFAVSTSGTNALILTPKTEGPAITLSSLSASLTDSPDSSTSPSVIHADPRPIRFAEVQVTDSEGSIVQCAETDGSGAFSLQLPSDGATYTVSVVSRSNNASNTAYIMNSPYENVAYKLSKTVTASGSPSVLLLAKATGDLLGGAFNILDQIYNAQNYLRTQTANCDSSGSANYFPDCTPFVTAPVVYTFWSAGLTPATYQGGTGGISYYGTPDGYESMRGLYILGGINGDTDNSDMDHFDNSVIVHEYGHFIEYNFGRMDSPGGSHSGNSVIDPRLAWGEGWADFLQGAVLDATYGTTTGTYRDTYGHTGCGGTNAQGLPGCTGVTFSEDLNVNPTTCSGCHDRPATSPVGEGNFREFSVSRLLYQVARTGGTSKFSEIWTIFHGPSNGMAVITDRFKTIGRAHVIQQAISGGSNWSALRTTESQAGDLGGYATPVNSSCTSTNRAMAILMRSTDDGSFTASDQFRNNDFLVYSHPGGVLTLTLSWSGSDQADLDLYIYPQGYVYGADGSRYANGWTRASRSTTTGTSGTETISASLGAGTYMINVMAYTGGYRATGTYNTTYNLTANNSPVCLAP